MRLWFCLYLGLWIFIATAAQSVFAVETKSSYNWIVKLKQNPDPELLQSLKSELSLVNVESLYENQNLILVTSRTNGKHIQRKINSHPLVKFAELDTQMSATMAPSDPDYPRLWGLENSGQLLERAGTRGIAGVDIDVKRAWGITTGSHDVVVAVADTGIDLQNPDLIDNIWVNKAEQNGKPGVDDDGNGFIDDTYGWDFYNDDNSPIDDNRHGTHIAGIIGASGNNKNGITGVNWNVKIMPIKWMGASLTGSMSGAVKAIHYAIDNGARIINCSWGEHDNDSSALRQALQRAGRENVLIVAAVGNEGYDIVHGPFYPASYALDHMITVAAINNRGHLWQGGGYASNYSSQLVDVAAPGEDIVSYTLKGLQPLSGTSMAAPFVSGVAALVLANEPELSNVELKQRLVSTVRTRPYLRGKIKTAGVVNAYHAVTSAPPPVDNEDPFNWNHSPYRLTVRQLPNSVTKTYIIHQEKAKKLSVHFERFFLESNDYVEFVDNESRVVARWTRDHRKEYSPPVDGPLLKIRVVTDRSLFVGGFQIDHISWK